MTPNELQCLIDGEDTMDSVYNQFSRWAQGRLQMTAIRREWEPFPDEIDMLIIHACGYKDVADAVYNFREETRQTLKLLAGPNGWTIYKMLKAQNDT